MLIFILNIGAIEMSKYKERLIAKHGFEKGSQMYDNWYKNICESRKNQYNLNYYIEKYGEVEGKKKLDEYKNKTSGSLKRFIKKYGKKEGKIKYDEFRNRCSHLNKEHRIAKFGEEKYNQSLKKYKERINNTQLEYWLIQENNDYEKAIKSFKARQTITEEKFINKYGINGKQKYNEYIKNKTQNFGGRSKPEIELTNSLYELIHKNFKEIYYHKNPYVFYTTKIIRESFNKKVFIPDFYIKDINLVIEFFGDYWHANPKKYESNDILRNTIVKEIWNTDKERIDFLKQQYKVDTIIIWESDYKKNKNLVIKQIMEIINERKSQIVKEL